MNGKKVALLIALIIFIDQAIKFYIKLNYFIGEEHVMLGSWARLHFIENEDRSEQKLYSKIDIKHKNNTDDFFNLL